MFYFHDKLYFNCSNLNSNLKNIFEKFVNIFSIFNLYYKNLDYLEKKKDTEKQKK